MQRLKFGVFFASVYFYSMSIPKPYRHPCATLLTIVLIFGLLLGACWFWYQAELQKLDEQLRQRQQQLEISPSK